MGTAADRPGPKKLDRLSDGVVAPVNAGVGAIDPSAERLDRTARADGIGGSAVGQYSPQFFSQEEGNTMALALPGRQARVPSTPLPSGQLESLRPTASEVLPSDNIPPHFSHRRRGMQWLWRYRVGRRGCHRPHCRAVSWNRSGRRHQSRSRRTISPPLGGEEYLYSPIGVCAGGEYDGFGATG